MSAEVKTTDRTSYQSEDRLSTLKQMVAKKLEAVKANKVAHPPAKRTGDRG